MYNSSEKKLTMVKKQNIALGLLLFLVSCLLSDQCGMEGNVNEISGGKQAHPNQYPWMVFYEVPKNGKREFCGGSLISSRLIITAKHCTKGDSEGEASLKMHDRRLDHKKVKISKVFTHENGKNNDIAIVLLSQAMDLNDPGIGTVCLPESENEQYIGEPAMAMGWGMTGVNQYGQVLKAVDLKVDTLQEPYFLTTTVAKINGVYQDPCAGDSGGPLVYKKNGRWTIIGTVSGGGYDCRSGEVAGPAIWNKVAAHLPWIKKIMKEHDGGSSSQGLQSPSQGLQSPSQGLQLPSGGSNSQLLQRQRPWEQSWRSYRTRRPLWPQYTQRGLTQENNGQQNPYYYGRNWMGLGKYGGYGYRPFRHESYRGAGVGAGTRHGMGNVFRSILGAGAGVGEGVRAEIGHIYKAGGGVGTGVGAGIGPNFEAGAKKVIRADNIIKKANKTRVIGDNKKVIGNNNIAMGKNVQGHGDNKDQRAKHGKKGLYRSRI